MAKVLYFDWGQRPPRLHPRRLLQRLHDEAVENVRTANDILADEGGDAPFTLEPLDPARVAGFTVSRARPDGEADAVTFSLRLRHVQVTGYRLREPLCVSGARLRALRLGCRLRAGGERRAGRHVASRGRSLAWLV